MLNEYQQRNKDNAEQYAKRITDVIPEADAEVIAKDSGNSYTIQIQYGGYTFIQYHADREALGLFIDSRSYDSVSHDKRSEINEEHPLNNVKKFTTKKVKAYLENEIAKHEAIKKCHADNISKYNDFLEKAKHIVPNIRNVDSRKEYSSVYNVWQMHGDVVKNGIEYSFTLHQDGWISEYIKVHYSAKNTLDNFVKISDNKFTDAE